ncbi:hypothetical protein, partial [Thiohalorhabdus sp.]|uniref:hypothetical protein n=1 Tax=Thiohalorhabdus sp. TaxID=3094134 RepID=UPI002FC36960
MAEYPYDDRDRPKSNKPKQGGLTPPPDDRLAQVKREAAKQPGRQNYFDLVYGDKEPQQEEGVGFGEALGDMGNQVMRGGAQTAGGGAWLLDQLGAEDTAASLRSLSEEAKQYWGEGISEEGKESLKRLHEGDLNAYGALLAASGSTLPTLAGMGAGGAAAKGLQAAGMGARGAGMAGYSAGESAVQAPVAAEETFQEILGMDHQDLMERSDPYRQAYQENIRNGLDEERARDAAKELVADAGSRRTAAYSGASTAALSAPFGGMLGRVAAGVPGNNRLANAATGAATEGAQEFAQEGSQRIAQNVAISQTADETQGPVEGALNAAIAGFGAGGVMGGAMGLAAPPGVEQPKQEPPQPQEPPEAPTPEQQRQQQAPSFEDYRQAAGQ